MSADSEIVDLFVIGGGVNGAGIARDAAGRGLSVVLCEKDDLAQGTSSRSGKLVHGGLRYLEYYEFRLVREALIEREVLLEFRAAHHLADALRAAAQPRRPRPPGWCGSGLFLYDHLGGRKRLPGTRTLDLAHRARKARRSRPRSPAASNIPTAGWMTPGWCVLNALDASAARRHDPHPHRLRLGAARGRRLARRDAQDGRTGVKPTVRGARAGQRRRPVGQRRDRPRRRAELDAQRAAGQGQPHRRAEILGGPACLSRPEQRQARHLRQSLRERSRADRHHRHSLRRPARGRRRRRGRDRLPDHGGEPLLQAQARAARTSCTASPACARSTTTTPTTRAR